MVSTNSASPPLSVTILLTRLSAAASQELTAIELMEPPTLQSRSIETGLSPANTTWKASGASLRKLSSILRTNLTASTLSNLIVSNDIYEVTKRHKKVYFNNISNVLFYHYHNNSFKANNNNSYNNLLC